MKSFFILIVLALVIGAIATGLKKNKRKRQSSMSRRQAHAYSKDVKEEPSNQGLNQLFAEGTKKCSPSIERRARYRDKFEFLNGAEQKLYWTLREAAPALLVFSQVSMSQVFHIDERTKDRRQKLTEIGKKSIDFLLCRPDDMSIAVAIELNGRTHEKEDRRQSDETKQRTLQEAGIPLIVLKPGEMPDVGSFRKMLAPHLVDRRKYEKERDQRLRH